MRAGRRAERFRGTADLPYFFRQPYGPGWALVGDAGYHKDPITAQGISDAFRDAELLAEAIATGLARLDEALADYERRRNEARCRCTSSPTSSPGSSRPPPEMQELFAALRGEPGADRPLTSPPAAGSSRLRVTLERAVQLVRLCVVTLRGCRQPRPIEHPAIGNFSIDDERHASDME